jgi:hypothetical protein
MMKGESGRGVECVEHGGVHPRADVTHGVGQGQSGAPVESLCKDLHVLCRLCANSSLMVSLFCWTACAKFVRDRCRSTNSEWISEGWRCTSYNPNPSRCSC